MEPGGQFELSGAPFRSINETEAELQEHLKDLEWLEQEFPDLDVLWAGFQPDAKREDISWMPKGRYKVMREYLPTRGELGLDMMKRNGHRPGESGFHFRGGCCSQNESGVVASPLITVIYGIQESSREETRDSIVFANMSGVMWIRIGAETQILSWILVLGVFLPLMRNGPVMSRFSLSTGKESTTPIMR